MKYNLKLFILFAFLLFVGQVAFTQKTKITNKMSLSKSKYSEIDKLYQKYKGSTLITIYTSTGDLLGEITIDTNQENKPISVKIQGESANKTGIAEFLSNTIKMKLHQGYIPTKVPDGWGYNPYSLLIENGLKSKFFEDGSFQVLMRKGSLYFRIDAGTYNTEYPNTKLVALGIENTDDLFQWAIETGDGRRRVGKNATKFEF